MIPATCRDCPCGEFVWPKCKHIDSCTDSDLGVPSPGAGCPIVLLAKETKERERLQRAAAILDNAREVLFSYSANEATAHPWWAICRKAGYAGGVVLSGPFFSRRIAEATLAGKRHQFGNNAYVFCFSGYDSTDYVTLRDILSLGKEA